MFSFVSHSRRGFLSLVLALLLVPGCQGLGQRGDAQSSPWADFEPLVAMEEGPTYHLLEGYDPIWLEHVREGVETSRAYWGSFGPAHVWVLGREEGTSISAEAKRAFLDEYCAWRTATSYRTVSECLPHAEERFFEVAERGDPEAYLSDVRDTDPRMAELIFINVHEWFFARDSIPDPVLRGIHEYTHVFQQSVAEIPTWMAEGNAVFMEAWLPWLERRREPEAVMRWFMQSARDIRDTGLSIADMEEIESAPRRVAKYHRELAYDSGAWATAFMVHESSTRSVSSLRDEFYPLVKELGWEVALARYVGMESKEEFYEAFAAFMELSIGEQLQLLEGLKE